MSSTTTVSRKLAVPRTDFSKLTPAEMVAELERLEAAQAAQASGQQITFRFNDGSDPARAGAGHPDVRAGKISEGDVVSARDSGIISIYGINNNRPINVYPGQVGALRDALNSGEFLKWFNDGLGAMNSYNEARRAGTGNVQPLK